jgi:hypothetical protein
MLPFSARGIEGRHGAIASNGHPAGIMGRLRAGCPGAAGQAGFDGTPQSSDARTDFDLDEAGASQEPGVFTRKPFRMTLAVREGFDSNVFQTSDHPVESFYTNWAAGLHYRTGAPLL